MHDENPTLPVPLRAAIAAWNENAQEFATPVLNHVTDSLRALQHLRVALRHYGNLDPALFHRMTDATSNGQADPAPQLQALCARIEAFAQDIAHLDNHAQTVSAQGESLMRDFLLLMDRPEAASELEDNKDRLTHHAHPLKKEPLDPPLGNTGLLDQLIDTQKAEITALSNQIAVLEAALATPVPEIQAEAPIPVTKVELQNVAAYLQGSSIAGRPANAAYVERILEAANTEEGHKVPMGQILTSAGVISDRQLENALKHQKDGRRQALGTLLVDLGYSNESAIAQALAAQLALPYVNLDGEFITAGAVETIPAHIARRHACFPISDNGHVLRVAMANPLDLIALEDLHIASGKHIRPCVAARSDITQHINTYYT